MDTKDKELAQLKKIISRLKDENEYLKSPLYLFHVTEQIQGNYSILLNPPSIDFRTTKGQKAAFFKIDINDIICVVSDGKSKWLHFIRPQISIDGARLTSEKLSFTGSLDEFCSKYDRPKIHLCIVSRSVAVNPFYYHLDKNRLMLNEGIIGKEVCNKIVVSPKFRTDFIVRKETIERIVSFQKIQIHSK
jgi:hypothetical protein